MRRLRYVRLSGKQRIAVWLSIVLVLLLVGAALIVVRLRPLEELPPSYRIHHLPLDVRFDWVWGG